MLFLTDVDHVSFEKANETRQNNLQSATVSLQVVIGLCKRKETAALKIKAAVSNGRVKLSLWHGGPFNHIGQFCFFIAFPFVYMMFLIYYSAYRIRSIKLNFRKFADTPYVSSTCKKATTQIKSTAGTTGK